MRIFLKLTFTWQMHGVAALSCLALQCRVTADNMMLKLLLIVSGHQYLLHHACSKAVEPLHASWCVQLVTHSALLAQLPSADECDALIHDRKLTAIVYFLDETFEELTYDVTTTVLEAVEQLAGIIKLQNYTTFTLYESRRVRCEICSIVPSGA